MKVVLKGQYISPQSSIVTHQTLLTLFLNQVFKFWKSSKVEINYRFCLLVVLIIRLIICFSFISYEIIFLLVTFLIQMILAILILLQLMYCAVALDFQREHKPHGHTYCGNDFINIWRLMCKIKHLKRSRPKRSTGILSLIQVYLECTH